METIELKENQKVIVEKYTEKQIAEWKKAYENGFGSDDPIVAMKGHPFESYPHEKRIYFSYDGNNYFIVLEPCCANYSIFRFLATERRNKMVGFWNAEKTGEFTPAEIIHKMDKWEGYI